MFEATVNEFPFVASLPKREKSKVAQMWDLIREVNEISKTEGNLLPVMLVARALDLGRTRIDQLCADGRLKRVRIDDHVFITENSLVEFAKIERQNGRPLKPCTNLVEAYRRARKPVAA